MGEGVVCDFCIVNTAATVLKPSDIHPTKERGNPGGVAALYKFLILNFKGAAFFGVLPP